MRKPVARLIPFGLGAGFILWAVYHLSQGPHSFWDNLRRPIRFHSRPHRLTSWPERAEAVRHAFLHAYDGYSLYAGNGDELLPLTEDAANNFNGWRLTLVDGLDTMWIMGFRDEFYHVMPLFSDMNFDLNDDQFAPFFETVIRYLGGLLSAYALSGEPVLLDRADELGRLLLPAFNTTSGLPMYAVNTVTGKTRMGWTRGAVLWSEALSCQLEYKFLAHLTGHREYYDSVERIMHIMKDANVTEGLFSTRWAMSNAMPFGDHFSVGAFADSAHEYLLKQWLLTSQSEPTARDLYLRAAGSILEHLLYITPNRRLLYVTDTVSLKPTHTFEHLSCFLPGLLALGAHTLDLPPRTRQLHEWAARGLAHTCWITYADQASGLGPDEMLMESVPITQESPQGGRWLWHVQKWEDRGQPGGVPPGLKEAKPRRSGRDYIMRKSGYFLRPETVESFYIMWRTTGDRKWRERGWEVFQAIERETKTRSGYASLQSVDESPAPKKNEMPSFFMAETLKYLYLLFTDEELIPLDRWVFNTEAHPLPIFKWTDAEKDMYNITGAS